MQETKEKRRISFLNARVTSTISISLVLFILGVIAMMSILGTQLTKYIKENMGFSIVLKDTAPKRGVEDIKRALNIAPYVRATQYISKDDALKELEVELGENPKDLLGFNPLQSSIEVKLAAEYANQDSLTWIEKGLRKHTDVVADIICQKDVIQLVNDNMRKAEYILLSLSVVLMIISFALISNTIRLMAYSKRFLIHTMKLVGATSGFIRRPFIINNIIGGIIASAIAMALLSGCAYYLISEFENLSILINIVTLLQVFAIVLALGIILTAISAYFAVNRYISMEKDDLYYM
ncbi:MAG: permease-like cell division protein FtsX [Bacteroidales bacterium]